MNTILPKAQQTKIKTVMIGNHKFEVESSKDKNKNEQSLTKLNKAILNGAFSEIKQTNE